MTKTVLITMSLVGIDVGPTLDLYSDVDGYSMPFETGVLKVDLEAGYTSTLVPDTAIRIRAYSIGVCTNYAQCSIAVAHSLGYSETDCAGACSETSVTYYSNCSDLVLYYCYLWTDPELTIEAPTGYYSDGVDCYQYQGSHSGFIAITPCPAPPYSSYSVRLSNSAAPMVICFVSPVVVFTASLASISPGTTVYTESALINEVVGYDFIVEAGSGSSIYMLGSGTGIIGGTVGFTC